MNRSPLTRWLAFAGCFAVVYAGFTIWRVHRWEETVAQEAAAQESLAEAAQLSAMAVKNSSAPPADFTLTNQNGKAFDSASLKGHVWVGSFFFTNCPAVCWRLNQSLEGLQAANPTSDLRLVSITCDPENDTPDALNRYAERFHADPGRWTFLTGDMATISRIGNELFKVSVEKGTHSDRAFIVDRKGQVRGRFRVTEPDQFEKLKKVLSTVVAEGPEIAAEKPAAAPDLPAPPSVPAATDASNPQPVVEPAPAAAPGPVEGPGK